MSNTVGASFKTLVGSGAITQDATATSHYCKFFNDLFDVLNSSSLLDKVPLRKPLREKYDGIDVLLHALSLLKELEEANKHRPAAKFIKGFRSLLVLGETALDVFFL